MISIPRVGVDTELHIIIMMMTYLILLRKGRLVRMRRIREEIRHINRKGITIICIRSRITTQLQQYKISNQLSKPNNQLMN